MPRDEQAPTPALFLTGKGDITRDFNAAFDKVRRGAGRLDRVEADAEAARARVRVVDAGRRAENT